MAKDDIVDAEGTGKPSSDAFLTGLVVFTTVALLAGFIIIEMAWKANYGRGMLS
jgi:hypothetical protein